MQIWRLWLKNVTRKPENYAPTCDKDFEILNGKIFYRKFFLWAVWMLFLQSLRCFSLTQKIPLRAPRKGESTRSADIVFQYFPLDTLKTDMATRTTATETSKTPICGKNLPICSSRLARSRFDDHADQFSSVVSEVRKQLENFRFLKQYETFPQNVLLTQKPAALTFLPKTFCQSTTIFCSKTGKNIKITFLFSFLYSYSSDIYKTLKILSQKENSKQIFTQNVFNYGYYSILTSLRNFLDKVPNEHRSNFGKT